VADIKLDSPLQYVKGVGPRKAEVLHQHGLDKVRDLLFYFPRSYLDRSSIVTINDLQMDQPATIIGEVKAHGVLYGRRKRYEVILQDETGAVPLLFFQSVRYWERLFKKGQIFAATGTPTFFNGLQLVHPDLERLDEGSDRLIHGGRIIPVYPQTAELNKIGLNSKGIRRLTTFIFDHLRDTVADYLSESELGRQKMLSTHDAITKIHYPTDRDEIESARRRLAFDELLSFQFMVFKRKAGKERTIKAHSYAAPDEKLKQFTSHLPFSFTDGQKKVLAEIYGDLRSEKPMFRMLQGDVGCGKTVVAVTAALYVALNDLQTAFMAPTEMRAEQHYRNWKEKLAEAGVQSGLLTSSLKATEKKEIARKCAEGEIKILFGTHALVYDYVQFDRLGMVVIDEQHRFGVEQRGKLYEKGANPDLLVMTATPIPRTLALTLYGDLDISTIDTLPPGRKPIRTVWRGKDARDKVYEYVRDEIKKGAQAYVIYPLIEKSDQLDLQNVEDAYKDMTGGVFIDCRAAMVHGRVKPAERDRILEQFRNSELDIIMATTVIEVGIDNPNATIMVIEHAERFGLAQLHQLRGRVGRGDKQSMVAAIAHHPISVIGRQRLEYFVGTTDGFKIAEADLELRGPGEVFGKRQSGAPEFRAANIARDQKLIEATRKLLERLFANPDSLPASDKHIFKRLDEQTAQHDITLGGG
jgi:ATP-dependent DNA helicase RecG